MSKELITPEEAQEELDELENDLDENHSTLNYDYEEINDKAQRILEWLKCVLSVGWVNSKIDDDLNEEAMRDQGTKDAKKVPTKPPANNTVPSEKEQEVINHYKKFASYKVEPIAIGMVTCAKKSIDQINALTLNLENEDRGTSVSEDLQDYQDNFKKARNYLNWFKQAHNLKRRVRYELDYGNFWAIVIIYLIFETFVNGFFYSKVADGLIEGWGIALTVAILVIAFGAGAGEFGTKLRGLTARNAPKEILGKSVNDLEKEGWHTSDDKEFHRWEKHGLLHMLYWGIITLGCLVAGLVVVAFAYIYRDAAEYLLNSGALDNLASAEATKAIMVDAGTRLRELALEPESGLSAITLIVVNGLGFIMSFYKFHFHRDDCIPGYAENCRHLKDMREDYKEAINNIDPSRALGDATRIEEPLENRMKKMKTFADGIREGTDALKSISPNLKKEYTDACRNLLESYREANKKARPKDDKEGPAYFNEELQPFDTFDINKFNTAHIELCTAIDTVKIDDIIRKTRNWRNALIQEHVVESDRDLDIELTEKEKQKKREKNIKKKNR